MTHDATLPEPARRNAADLARLFGLPSILAATFLYFALAADTFLLPDSLLGLLQSAAISILLFLGLTWVYTIGEMDVSFVAIAALANMTVAGLVAAGLGWPVAVAAAIAASLAFGLLNGVLIGVLELPSLVTTIATGGIATAIAFAIGKGSSLGIDEPSFLHFLFTTRIAIFSLVALVVAALVAACWYVQERLTLGHYVFAIASNKRAAVEAGIPVARITVLLCVFAALCSGAAGILIAVELASGQPSIARSLFLDGLTAVLLGGTMIRLGRPNVLGTVVGVLIVTTLVRGGALLGWNDAAFQAIKGCLLILGVSIVAWANLRRT